MRILFIGWNRLGDGILSTALYRGIVARHPDAAITVVCGPLASEAIRHAPNLERLYILVKQRYNVHWMRAATQFLGSRWDLVVDLRDSLLRQSVFGRRKMVFRNPSPPRNVYDRLSELWGAPLPYPRLWPGDAAVGYADARLVGLPPPLALGIGSAYARKRWPVGHFVRLARMLERRFGDGGPLPFLLVGAPDEVSLTQAFARDYAAVAGPVPIVDLAQEGASILAQAACIGRSRLFVGNDSGFMHAAAALDVPTVGIFGPTNPRIYRPIGRIAGYAKAGADEAVVDIADTVPDLVYAEVERLVGSGAVSSSS